MEDGRWKMENGRWKMEDGKWKMEDGKWKRDCFKFSKCFCLAFFILIYSAAFPQIYSEKDSEICNSKFQLAVQNALSQNPVGDIVAEIGKSFIGTNYKASTLEKEGAEQLVINLSGLDCTTFLETSLALAICVKSGKNSFEDYQKELTKIRYRDGVIDKYPSRLHYFSDWIFDNEKKGIVKDITKDLGGGPVRFQLNFMSSHPQSYKQLKENPEFIPIIKKQEEEISKREYFFIPKEKVSGIEKKIQNGDLIAFVTNIKGLDISHTGIALRKSDGRIYLLHAPSEGSKVQISNLPLPEYLGKVKKHIGIILLRPQDPPKI